MIDGERERLRDAPVRLSRREGEEDFLSFFLSFSSYLINGASGFLFVPLLPRNDEGRWTGEGAFLLGCIYT